ncbi:MAG: hypothetical protein ACOC31_03285 [Bacteroidota bacterium]
MKELIQNRQAVNSLEITYRAGKIQQPEREIDTLLQHKENISEYSFFNGRNTQDSFYKPGDRSLHRFDYIISSRSTGV